MCADILSGQGLYYETLDNSWRARNCTHDMYGVPNITIGLSPFPCRNCKCTATPVSFGHQHCPGRTQQGAACINECPACVATKILLLLLSTTEVGCLSLLVQLRLSFIEGSCMELYTSWACLQGPLTGTRSTRCFAEA